MFSCEFWEILKKTFFTEHLRKTASVTCLAAQSYYEEIKPFIPKLEVHPTAKVNLIFKFYHPQKDHTMNQSLENDGVDLDLKISRNYLKLSKEY